MGLLFALPPAAAQAQAPPDDLAALQLRLDRLERENAELKATVEQRLPYSAAGQSYYTEVLPPPGEGDRVRSIVEEYLAQRERGSPAGYETSAAVVEAAGANLAPPSDPEWTQVGQDLSMAARWNNGLEVATKDKAFRIHVGGRWQLDTSWFSADQAVQQNLPGNVMYHDGIDFRRARLRIDGTMYEVIEFACEYDFVNGLRVGHPNNSDFLDQNVPALTDLWLQYSHTPLGNIRIGNQKEAIGFEHIVSSRFLPFMERSYNQDTFYGGAFNGFIPGASINGNVWEDRASYHLGLYKPTNNVFGFSTNDGDYSVTGRLTWLPIYEQEGRQLLHLGASVRQATTYDDRLRFRTRDAIRAGVATQWPVPADITVFGDTVQWFNFELAAVQGPWTLQAEWLLSNTHDAQRVGGGPLVQDLLYQGGYVQLLYFLTGESDTYSLERMAFDRMKPFENAFWLRDANCESIFGRGAWQVGARYNFLDLNDQGINGGQLHNFTAGLNWFWNPNSKWQFNYFATYRDVSQASDANIADGSGWIHGWGMRFAQDF